jgi:hypothetical protein
MGTYIGSCVGNTKITEQLRHIGNRTTEGLTDVCIYVRLLKTLRLYVHIYACTYVPIYLQKLRTPIFTADP